MYKTHVTKYYLRNASRDLQGSWVIWSVWSDDSHKIIGYFNNEYLALAELVLEYINKSFQVDLTKD